MIQNLPVCLPVSAGWREAFLPPLFVWISFEDHLPCSTSHERNKKNRLLRLFLHGASLEIPHFGLQEFPRNSTLESVG
jgi:hypothetical protein